MHEFPCPSRIAVDVRVPAGSVEVHAEPRETALVEVEPYDASEAAAEAAAATRVELSGDTLLIAAPEASGWQLRRTPRLRVTVRVPTGSAGRFRLASADLTCAGEWASAKLNTASGDVAIDHITGDLTVNTASGDVRTGRVGGRLTVRTASGDVVARHATGVVDITSASGHVQLDEAETDVRVKTASGNASIGQTHQGTVRANAVSGDVSIGVLAGTGVWLDLNTVAGKTLLDLNMGGGDDPSHQLTVQVRTVSGNIDVHRVPQPAAAT